MGKTLPFAGATPSLNFPAIISDVLNSLSEAAAGVLSPALPLLNRLKLILLHLQQTETPAPQNILEALNSLQTELQRSFTLVRKPAAGSPVSTIGLIENSVQGIGRCLGPLSLAWPDAGGDLREEMGLLQREMLFAKLDLKREADGGEIAEDVEDVVMRVKRGEDEVLTGALDALEGLIGDGLVGEEEREDVVRALVGRLGSAKNGCRLKIIVLLRRLADDNDECKVSFDSVP